MEPAKRRKTARLAAAVCAAAALFALLSYASGMTAAEAVRRLSGLRVAAALYRMEFRAAPADFEEVLSSGKLEAVPRLKLPWHPSSSKVRNTPHMAITDSGGWAYVNDPHDPAFGLIYIDCSHRDEKGRFWSEF